jgi:hypothetical protein
MSDGEEWFEDKYIGSRMFRRMADGQIVEVLPDGSIRENYEVEGRHFDSWDADLDSIAEAFTPPAPAEPEPQPEPEQIAAPEKAGVGKHVKELSMEERIQDYIAGKRGYVGVDKKVKTFEYSASGMYHGSIKKLLNDSPKAHGLHGSHSMGGMHGLRSGSKVQGTKEDPLKRIFKKTQQKELIKKKETSYKEHINKTYGSEAKDIMGSKTALSPDGTIKSTGLSRRIRGRKGK